MTWQLVAAANVVAAAAYAAIGLRLARGAARRSDRPAAATAAVLLTGAAHHVVLGAQLLAPEAGLYEEHGRALRDGWSPLNVVVDAGVAGAAVWFLTARGRHRSADARERERQALEINDNIVQGLTVAQYALQAGADEQSRQAIEDTLRRARGIITDLLAEPGRSIELGPGDLRREHPADVSSPPPRDRGG